MPFNNFSEVELSVFMPAFNEEESIKTSVNNVDGVLKTLGLKNYETIIIDDGSKDKTAEIVKIISDNNKKVRLVGHVKNLGYGRALITGFTNSVYPWVAFVDSDGQFDFSEIKKFLEFTDSADLILGYRLNRADPFQRRVFTWGWKMLAMVVLGLNVKDYSCGFKLIRKRVFESILPIKSEEKVTQIEMLIKAKRQGYRFAEVGVRHYRRMYGVPTGAKLSVVLKSFIDLMRLRWNISRLNPSKEG